MIPPRRFVPVLLALPTAAAFIVSCSSPTEPSSASTYLASVAFSDTTSGLLTLTSSGSAAASGSLLPPSGDLVALEGTFADGAFDVSGGGYSFTATVGNTGISGMGTAPGGEAATVAPIPLPPGSAPPGSITRGVYRGSFTATTVFSARQTSPSGAVVGACNLSFVLNGTLELEVEEVQGSDVSTHLDLRWTETGTAGVGPGGTTPACGQGTGSSQAIGLDFDGPAGRLQYMRMQTGRSGSGSVTRTQGFSGAPSGNAIVGTVILAYKGTVPIPQGTNTETYPVTRVTVTLTRR